MAKLTGEALLAGCASSILCKLAGSIPSAEMGQAHRLGVSKIQPDFLPKRADQGHPEEERL
jgi:hypothetical protein